MEVEFPNLNIRVHKQLPLGIATHRWRRKQAIIHADPQMALLMSVCWCSFRPGGMSGHEA